jgi:hypothetical protein
VNCCFLLTLSKSRVSKESEAVTHAVRTMTEDLVVCGDYPNLAKHLPKTLIETDLDYAPGTGHTSPGSTFRLGLLADASIAIRREGSALEITEPAECISPTGLAPRARRHALDESTEERVKGLLGVATDSRISHGPTHQTSTQKLLNTLPSSIRSRASSLDEPRPLFAGNFQSVSATASATLVPLPR